MLCVFGCVCFDGEVLDLIVSIVVDKFELFVVFDCKLLLLGKVIVVNDGLCGVLLIDGKFVVDCVLFDLFE